MESGLRFAAIDIGSNAMRLLFTRVIEKKNGKPFFIKESLIRMPLRLGHDAFTSGVISKKNCESFLYTIFGFKNLKGYDTQRLYAYLAERYLSFWFNKHTKVLNWPWIFFDANQ